MKLHRTCFLRFSQAILAITVFAAGFSSLRAQSKAASPAGGIYTNAIPDGDGDDGYSDF